VDDYAAQHAAVRAKLETIRADSQRVETTANTLLQGMRVTDAETAIHRLLTKPQQTALNAAHEVGVGEPGKDGTPAKVDNYTPAQIAEKARILKDAGFTSNEIRTLMEKGIVGEKGGNGQDVNEPLSDHAGDSPRTSIPPKYSSIELSDYTGQKWNPTGLYRTAMERAALDALPLQEFILNQIHLNATRLRQVADAPETKIWDAYGKRFKAWLYDLEIKRIQRDGFSEEDLAVAAQSGLGLERKAMLDALQAYVPGLDSKRIVSMEHLRGNGVGYLADRLFGLEDAASFMWVSGKTDLAEFLEIAAHEGFHNGDGSNVGKHAAQILYGTGGYPIYRAIDEGYTEWRARDAMIRVLDDGDTGRSELGQKYRPALISHLRILYKDLSSNDASLLARWSHDRKRRYQRFVEIVKPIIEKPHGREALDAMVSRGDWTGLITVVGPLRMHELSWALLAESNANYLAAWRPLISRLPDFIRGRLSGSEIATMTLESREIDNLVSSVLQRKPFNPQEASRVEKVLESQIDSGASPADTLEAIRTVVRDFKGLP
jgi:hypothetical protein